MEIAESDAAFRSVEILFNRSEDMRQAYYLVRQDTHREDPPSFLNENSA